jgi:hypothetical protein
MREAADKAVCILRAIPGVKSVVALDAVQKQNVVGLETLSEKSRSLPVRNLGVSLMAQREMCLVLLKTAVFRAPRAPSVYLVEERGDVAEGISDHLLVVAGKVYTIVGEELTKSLEEYSEPTLFLEGSFVIFPARRSGPAVPCFFLLPPLPFPELDAVREQLGICEVSSISPSLAADAYLREVFDFPLSNSFATLLVGFDFCPP